MSKQYRSSKFFLKTLNFYSSTICIYFSYLKGEKERERERYKYVGYLGYKNLCSNFLYFLNYFVQSLHGSKKILSTISIFISHFMVVKLLLLIFCMSV